MKRVFDCPVLFVAAWLSTLFGLRAIAAPPADWAPVAKQLQSATVTVRVCTRDCPKPEPAGDKESTDKQAVTDDLEPARPHVSVCSGFYISPKQVVTAIRAGTDSSIRLTCSDGSQACGDLKVIDEYSGLVLLETDEQGPARLELGSECPTAGNWVMTAAAWGTEKPLVSLGIVSANDRAVAGINYPPLLQCDLRISATSGGAAVVDQECKVAGVIVAADAGDARRGWAYAVPASHIARLLRARPEEDSQRVVVLKRRRPIVGLVLDGDEHGIFVSRVHKDTPAEKAGILVGDEILATEGVKIRSVYQAVLPTLRKQPGDLLTLRIKRNGGERDVSLTLGGGVELASAPLESLGGIIQPKLDIQSDKRGSYQLAPQESGPKDLRGNGVPPIGDSAQERQRSETVERYRSELDALRAEIEVLRRENAELKSK